MDERVVDTCKEPNVVVGHPHVETDNVERIVKEGYRFLMCAPVRSYGHLAAAQKWVGEPSYSLCLERHPAT